ncbi:MAG: sugar transferase [Solirubrobacterales bacterium]|nr:sugar transferase [Solirubrobacterales bacterium]
MGVKEYREEGERDARTVDVPLNGRIALKPTATEERPQLASGEAVFEVHDLRGTTPAPFPAVAETAPSAYLRSSRRLKAWGVLQGPTSARMKLLFDYGLLTLATAIAAVWFVEPHVTSLDAFLIAFFPPSVTFALAIKGAYHDNLRAVALDKIGHVVTGCSISAFAVLGLHQVLVNSSAAGPRVLSAWALATALLVFTTGLTAIAQRRVRASGRGTSTLILGAGQVGTQVWRRLNSHPEYGLRPIGFLDIERPGEEHTVPGMSFLGTFLDLEKVVLSHQIEHAILAFSTMRDRDTVQLIKRCEALGVSVSVIPRFFEVVNGRARFEFLGGIPLVRTQPVVSSGWRYYLKHFLDRLIAAFLVLAAAPLFVALAIAVKLSSPGPVLFSQRRIGRDGREFDLLKFRSMGVAPPDDWPSFRPAAVIAPGGVEGVDRRTRVGRLLRRTSLDELAQLLNVLRGDMSLVGPRPERPEFVLLFREQMPRYQDRLRVKAGMTGWAQVHGLRGQTSVTDRLEWDNHYIENWSLALDLKILMLTVLAVLKPQED